MRTPPPFDQRTPILERETPTRGTQRTREIRECPFGQMRRLKSRSTELTDSVRSKLRNTVIDLERSKIDHGLTLTSLGRSPPGVDTGIKFRRREHTARGRRMHPSVGEDVRDSARDGATDSKIANHDSQVARNSIRIDNPTEADAVEVGRPNPVEHRRRAGTRLREARVVVVRSLASTTGTTALPERMDDHEASLEAGQPESSHSVVAKGLDVVGCDQLVRRSSNDVDRELTREETLTHVSKNLLDTVPLLGSPPLVTSRTTGQIAELTRENEVNPVIDSNVRTNDRSTVATTGERMTREGPVVDFRNREREKELSARMRRESH